MKYFIRQNLEILVFCTVIITVAAGTAALYFAEELLDVAAPLFTQTQPAIPAEPNIAPASSQEP